MLEQTRNLGCLYFVSVNKTGTSKVGAISEAQKAQKKFGKKLNFLKKFFFFQKKSHSAEKCKRGILLDLLTYIPLQNIKKLEGGTLWGQKKISKKKSHSAEKNSKGDPIVSSCFVSYDKNGLTERGDPLHYLKCAASILVELYLVVER